MSETKTKLEIINYPVRRKIKIGDIELPIISSNLEFCDTCFTSSAQLTLVINLDEVDIVDVKREI